LTKDQFDVQKPALQISQQWHGLFGKQTQATVRYIDINA
jgi:hypothetical protein